MEKEKKIRTLDELPIIKTPKRVKKLPLLFIASIAGWKSKTK